MLSNTNYDAERASHYVRRFIERKVAGVAVMTSELDATLVGELARRDVSVVFLDLGESGTHMSNLRVNYESGIDEAVQHLVSLGHRRIAFIGGPAHLRSAARRLEAFQKSMRRYLPDAPSEVYHGDFKLEGGRRAACEMLAAREPPTAVVAANDMMALGVSVELRAAGLNIPRDVSVVGFDDIAFAALADPQLTTVCLPRIELGRRAVEALMIAIEHPEQRGVEIDIPTYLLVRGSTAPARVMQQDEASIGAGTARTNSNARKPKKARATATAKRKRG